MTNHQRHLAAIMFSDIVGYTAMMETNETEGKDKAKHYRKILQKHIDSHAGTLVQNYGDGSLTTFTSVVDAVHCARAIQEDLKGTTPYVPLRIGIHLGDIVVEDDEIYGNGVNVASRIESMGVEGAILLSKPVFDQLRNHREFQLTSLGKFEFKNVEEPLEIFALSNDGFPVPSKKHLKGKFKEKKTTRKSILLSSIFIIAMIAGGWWLWQQFQAGEKNAVRSLAVLPFDNFTGDNSQEYLFAGIRDNLITSLWKIGSLRVPSKKSTDQHTDSTKSIREIASELGVDALIGTAVTRLDDSIQINVKLMQAFPEEDLVWTDVFERPVRNISSLFNEITQAIAREVSLKLTEKEKGLLSEAREIDPRAIRAYQNGRFHWYKATPQDLKLATQYFEEAINIDPKYAVAYVGLADAIATPAHLGYVPPGDLIDKAKDLLLKALKLEPNLAEAHDLLARVRFAGDWQWQDAEAEFNKAIELSPGFADVRAIYAQYLMTRGRKEEALAQNRKAKELDPLNVWTHYHYNWGLYYAGRYQEAIDSTRKILQEIKELPGGLGYATYSELLFKTGQLDESLKMMSISYLRNGDSVLAQILESGIGNYSFSDNMKRVANELSERSGKIYIKPVFIASSYMMAGERKEALMWLKKACDEKDSFLVYMVNSPIFADVHDDPVFRDILQKMNLSEKDLIVR